MSFWPGPDGEVVVILDRNWTSLAHTRCQVSGLLTKQSWSGTTPRGLPRHRSCSSSGKKPYLLGSQSGFKSP